MCKDLLTKGILQYQQKQLEEDDTPEARVLRNAIINYIGGEGEEKDSILDSGYKLASMREDLAEELEQLNPNDKVDKEFIDVNRKLSEALRQYIIAHYGEWVLYSNE